MLFLFFFFWQKNCFESKCLFKKKSRYTSRFPFHHIFFEPQILRHSLLRTYEYVKFLVCVCVYVYVNKYIYIYICTYIYIWICMYMSLYVHYIQYIIRTRLIVFTVSVYSIHIGLTLNAHHTSLVPQHPTVRDPWASPTRSPSITSSEPPTCSGCPLHIFFVGNQQRNYQQTPVIP